MPRPRAIGAAVALCLAVVFQPVTVGQRRYTTIEYDPVPRSVGGLAVGSQAAIVGRVERREAQRIFLDAPRTDVPRTPFKVVVLEALYCPAADIRGGQVIEVAQDGSPPDAPVGAIGIRPVPDRFLQERNDYLMFLVKLPDQSMWGFRYGAASFARLDRADDRIEVPGSWVVMPEFIGNADSRRIAVTLDRVRALNKR